MAKIGFITTRELPAMPASDVLAKAELKKLGHAVHAIRWDTDDSVDGLDLLVFRSCWNYHLHPAEFRRWIESLDVSLLNPAATVFWNFDKRYLMELAAHVPVVPTEVILDPTPTDIALIRSRRGWNEIVVKPSIGATSYQNRRLLTEEDFADLGNQALPAVALIQPYLRTIHTHGEFALTFFDGAYSHAVLKMPAAGEYRVQEEFGGLIRAIEAPEEVFSIAQRAIDFLPETPVYARVDIVIGDEGPMLMELELIEPELYIDRVPEAAARFAAAIHDRIL